MRGLCRRGQSKEEEDFFLEKEAKTSGFAVAGSRPPLVLTLVLDAEAAAWFDALRRIYFPPERLVVDAHVTMFHALPGAREAEAIHLVGDLCEPSAPFTVQVTGLRFLGRGVAFALAAPQAAALRAQLAEAFADDLTTQDRAPWSPHVTVQNKVTPELARQTFARLQTLAPPSPEGCGLALWRYLGGPWEHLRTCRFGSGEPVGRS